MEHVKPGDGEGRGRSTLQRSTLWASLVVAAACGVKGPSGPDPSGAGGTSGSSASQVGSSSGAATVGSSSGSGFTPNVPPSFTIEGRVVDQDGQPLSDATVLQGGHSDAPTLASAADGTFVLAMTYTGLGTPTVVASKRGYRTAGMEILTLPSEPLELVLHAAAPPDNEAYTYGKP